MSELFEKLGGTKPAMLLADPQGADIIAVNMEPEKGVVKAGTVLYKTPEKFWAPASSVEAVDTKELAVLAETVDTAGLKSTGTVAEVAAAYRAGRLIAGKVMLTEDAPLTPAIELVLRKQGIVLDQMTGTGTFNNVKGA